MTSPPPPTPSLSQVLAARARAASDGRLVLDVCGGLIAMTLAVVLRPPGWAVLVPLAVIIACYGTWGIADRALADARGSAAQLLRALRRAAAIIGAIAALGVVLVIMGFALGNWIH